MSSDYFLQISYAKQLGPQLDRFKVKRESPFHAEARCPVCLDSAKSKTKTRFSIYSKNSELNVGCFNCGLSTTFPNFLKLYYSSLFSEYKFDKFRISDTGPIIKTDFTPSKPVIKSTLVRLDLPLVSDLEPDHPAAIYVASRKLPRYPFYFCQNFYSFSSQYNDTFRPDGKPEARIIIPFFDRSGEIFAYQGRDLFGGAKQKYITVKIREKAPLLFGISTLDVSKPIILVEGPLDSLFLNNCLAAVGSSLIATADKLTKVTKKENITLVFDCEPRNESICFMYEDAIKREYKIVIWPKNQKEKDINNLILSGKDPQEIINKNTYVGLTAKIMFDAWKKI